MKHRPSSRPIAHPPASDAPWWRRTTVYQVYPRSFADSNGDGIGDLRGVIGKLDHLRDLGVETIWLSPFFDSPQADFGYDIRDHFGVSGEYGSLDDCRALIDEVHARGMKVVFDMVLNHTSEEHPWFVESRRSRELRAVVDAVPGTPRFVVGEVFGAPHALRRYCGEDADGLHLVFLFRSMRAPFTGPGVRALIDEFEREFPDPLLPTYVFGNHDRPRSTLRLGNHAGKAKLLAMLQLTARGVPFIYYGEEIGMHHHDIPVARGRDPLASQFRLVPDVIARRLRRAGILLNRDECRTPMQWNSGPNAGFAPPAATPWLAPHANRAEVNVAAQSHDPRSILSCYRALLALRRRSLALQAGSLELLDLPGLPPSVVSYRRVYGEGDRAEVAEVRLNVSSREVLVDLPALRGRTALSTLRGPIAADVSRLTLGAYEGVVALQG